MSHDEFTPVPDEDDGWVSKTQLKQQADALHDVGKTLVGLSAAALKTIPMNEDLADAVALAQRINKKKDGYRRQLQLIGKLLRQTDAEPIEHALSLLNAKQRQSNQAFHAIEVARDELIQQGDDAIQALLHQYPELDRQRLRQLVRQAKKQAEQNKPPKASREIFQYLKTVMPSAS
ncbi:ribosome biogenesis factor YjgA [Glaciecola sp. HTCC2999]|jgi:ribosome-associated protein|uniref:ribosome biogenesis factor YjgA n=1 Tax=Glaciecola sp. HTCC2999 TaxID=455436 RepID=UPI0000E105FF|nr:ribosome biogenesis factor YjgA [Glaciecola sp. HTCC2999]